MTYDEAFLQAQPNGQDARLVYVFGADNALVINISTTPDGSHRLYIENIKGNVPFCEGALELLLNQGLQNPQLIQHPEKTGQIRIPRGLDAQKG